MRSKHFERPSLYRIDDLSDPRELVPATSLRDRVYAALTIMATQVSSSSVCVGRVTVDRERVRFLAGRFGVTSHQINKAIEGLAMRRDITFLGIVAKGEVAS